MPIPVSKTHARHCRRYYRRLVGPLRETARACGYALAVHGSLRRDVDLVACPWTPQACPAGELAEAMRATIRRVLDIQAETLHQWAVWDSSRYYNESASAKPWGRLSYVYYFDGDCQGPYLDLSVMPRAGAGGIVA